MILTAILVMVIGICTFNTVNAAYEVQSEKLPIKTIINLVDDDSEEKENVVLENESFNYVLTPLTEGAPLPAGSQDGKWNISVKGDYREGMTPEQTIVIINKALDCAHQRGDLSSIFIVGGSKTLSAISESIKRKKKQIIVNENQLLTLKNIK